MSFVSQTAALTATGIRGIAQRKGAAFVTVFGIVTVVAVLLSLLSISAGLKQMAMAQVHTDRAVIISRGATNVGQSSLPRATVLKVFEAPYVKKQPDGRPEADAVSMTQVDVLKKDGRRGVLYLAGITQNRPRQPPEFTIVAGRDFKPAVRELVVSEAVRDTYRNTNIGDRLKLRGSEWTVVGVYKNTGGGSDSQALTDAETFMSAFNRNEYMQADVTLASFGDFQKLKDTLTSDPSISVDVKTEAEMQQANFGQLYRLFDFVAYFIGAVMASGAIFGALNALYASVDTRRREIATLRALGFGNGAIVISVLAEALVLALPAALVGTLVAWLFFNGDVANIQGLVFKLAITPDLAKTAIFWAITIGLIGGSLPALRAARLPVATALRRT
jgi:putative ABC transport system permease protein